MNIFNLDKVNIDDITFSEKKINNVYYSQIQKIIIHLLFK